MSLERIVSATQPVLCPAASRRNHCNRRATTMATPARTKHEIKRGAAESGKPADKRANEHTVNVHEPIQCVNLCKKHTQNNANRSGKDFHSIGAQRMHIYVHTSYTANSTIE